MRAWWLLLCVVCVCAHTPTSDVNTLLSRLEAKLEEMKDVSFPHALGDFWDFPLSDFDMDVMAENEKDIRALFDSVTVGFEQFQVRLAIHESGSISTPGLSLLHPNEVPSTTLPLVCLMITTQAAPFIYVIQDIGTPPEQNIQAFFFDWVSEGPTSSSVVGTPSLSTRLAMIKPPDSRTGGVAVEWTGTNQVMIRHPPPFRAYDSTMQLVHGYTHVPKSSNVFVSALVNGFECQTVVRFAEALAGTRFMVESLPRVDVMEVPDPSGAIIELGLSSKFNSQMPKGMDGSLSSSSRMMVERVQGRVDGGAVTVIYDDEVMGLVTDPHHGDGPSVPRGRGVDTGVSFPRSDDSSPVLVPRGINSGGSGPPRRVSDGGGVPPKGVNEGGPVPRPPWR